MIRTRFEVGPRLLTIFDQGRLRMPVDQGEGLFNALNLLNFAESIHQLCEKVLELEDEDETCPYCGEDSSHDDDCIIEIAQILFPIALRASLEKRRRGLEVRVVR